MLEPHMWLWFVNAHLMWEKPTLYPQMKDCVSTTLFLTGESLLLLPSYHPHPFSFLVLPQEVEEVVRGCWSLLLSPPPPTPCIPTCLPPSLSFQSGQAVCLLPSSHSPSRWSREDPPPRSPHCGLHPEACSEQDKPLLLLPGREVRFLASPKGTLKALFP